MEDQTYLDAPYLSIRWRSVPQIGGGAGILPVPRDGPKATG
jgi:hypothetical protein